MPKPSPALPPAIMLQGTCSNAGKSLLAMALCRILTRAGYAVAPFKAQNMSLNSFVTDKGEEIGRAQALQAEACGRRPDTRMNPLLLKPLRDQGSQMLVLGHPKGVLTSDDFARFRADLWDVVTKAYVDLAKDAEIMVLEGAGSPAEINLRAHDLVNMRMARFAKARVLLTADIDRGGAFAAIVGTMALLRPKERATIAGYLINKFRGKRELLNPALAAIEARTGRPFFGVIPWIERLRLPDEDGVPLAEMVHKASRSPEEARATSRNAHVLDIAILALPHMSNATDFDALSVEPDLHVRYCTSQATLGEPDLVILPGTRTSAFALEELRAHGLDRAIVDFGHACLTQGRGRILGICGGFQVLGDDLLDPDTVEARGTHRGLGLLPVTTTFTKDKTLTPVSAYCTTALLGQECQLQGYEIHHGQTRPSAGHPDDSCIPLLRTHTGRILGYGRRACDGEIRILGTYLHGLFDTDAFRTAFFNRLRAEKGLPELPSTHYSREGDIDRVADIVERELPLAQLLALLKLA